MLRQRNELYEFGEFRLDVGERRLERIDGSAPAALPEKAFQTLVHLVRNPGTLITKDELISAVWPEAIVEENNLGKAIHMIRQTLKEQKGSQKYIETVPKHGYRFVAEVLRVEPDAEPGRFTKSGAHAIVDRAVWEEMAGEGTADGGHKEPGEPLAPDAEPASRRKFTVIALIAIVLTGGILVGWMFMGNGPGAAGAVNDDGRAGSPAFELYMRGKVRVASENREDTLAAITTLEEAVAMDPNFAKAYAALARGYNTMAFKYSTGAERKRWHENAEVAIEKALEIDPNLAEAHFARGLILWTNTRGFPHERAIQSFKRSLAIDEADDETHHQLSLVYSHIGLMDEARREVDKALEINPNNTLARYRTGVYLQYQGRFEEALAAHKTIPRDFTPLLVERTMAETLIQTGRHEEAETIVDDHLGKFPQDEGGSFTSVKALLLAKAGRHAEAEEMIRRAEEIGSDFGHFHHTAYNIASAYAAMNRPEDAVRWLERTADSGFPNYSYFQIDPNLDLIRQDPGFTGFMANLKTRWERYKADPQ